MKLNDNFLIHDTGSGEMLIPVEEETKKFHGIVKLNETGSEICHLLDKYTEVISKNQVNCNPKHKESLPHGVTGKIPINPDEKDHSSVLMISFLL